MGWGGEKGIIWGGEITERERESTSQAEGDVRGDYLDFVGVDYYGGVVLSRSSGGGGAIGMCVCVGGGETAK